MQDREGRGRLETFRDRERVTLQRSPLPSPLPGVSQTLLEAAITQPRPVFSCFVNLLQSEEARKQIILVIDGPAA